MGLARADPLVKSAAMHRLRGTEGDGWELQLSGSLLGGGSDDLKRTKILYVYIAVKFLDVFNYCFGLFLWEPEEGMIILDVQK